MQDRQLTLITTALSAFDEVMLQLAEFDVIELAFKGRRDQSRHLKA